MERIDYLDVAQQFVKKYKLKSKVVFDGRNLYDLDNMRELGFNYYSIGRTTILS